MRWLFRFNVATERETGSTHQAQGFGHARRCAAVAKTVRDTHGHDVLLVIRGPNELAEHFKSQNLPFVINADERAALDEYHPTIIVVDINDLAPERIRWYRRWAPVVNFAPRGLPKYHADATFTAITSADIPAPPGISPPPWFRGPQYAVVGEEFSRLREGIESLEAKWDERCVVVSMGGVDHHNLTGAVVRHLGTWREDVKLKVIAGPLCPHTAKLKALLKKQGRSAEVVVNPADVAREIVEASVGVFGAGIVAYEALCVGVPGVHVGLAPFHRLVGQELSELGVGHYGGDSDQLGNGSLPQSLSKLLDHPTSLQAVRRKGMGLVDGQGPRRIIDQAVQLFG